MPNVELTAQDYKMTRKTADHILLGMSKEERALCVFYKAAVKFKKGTRERFCLFFDGHKIRNAREWRAFQTPEGFTSASLAKLHALTEENDHAQAT